MKTWLVLVLLAILVSGCSWQKVRKILDDAEWERSDRTIRVVDMIVR